MHRYIVTSLETHLFFARIMKEHALFLQASFPAGEEQYQKEADYYREQFEKVLETTVQLANGNVPSEVLDSGEEVTNYTEMAERQTRKLTGIPIDIRITQMQKRMQPGCKEGFNREMIQQVRNLNRRVLQLLRGLITFKETIIKAVTACDLYTSNYPLLIEHILREARWYFQMIWDIENGRMSSINSRRIEIFWNQIMMEHAQFIRGLLDPTEDKLINTADEFSKDYRDLLELAKLQECRVSEELTKKTLAVTLQYRDFKDAGTQGITDCKIRSVILPLLADHVLREANYYLRLLKDLDMAVQNN